MTEFRENILDILDAWEGYTVKDPCSKDPAYNSGHVQLKCYINNVCPFHKTPYVNESLVFNTETFTQVESNIPKRITSVLTTTPGLEGVHFKPKKVFRHNYMYKSKTDDSNYNPRADTEERLLNFDTYYKEVSLAATAMINGADQTRYKSEYSWIMVSSVFDYISRTCAIIGECSIDAQWSYKNKPVPNNIVGDKDIEYDYKYDHWLKYKDSFEPNFSGAMVPKTNEDPQVSKFTIQVPMQNKVHRNGGVHWKVTKKSPIFRGCDFFIRFYKGANEPVHYDNNIGKVWFNNSFYAPLDYTTNKKIIIDRNIGLKEYINEAIRSPDKDEIPENSTNVYDFYTQAYYIIEIGAEYFIIIPARGNPTFVQFFKGGNSKGTFSKRLGEPFKGVTGDSLINAKFFDITVRNHLGKLVIQFEGAGLPEIPPWIVTGANWTIGGDQDNPYLEENLADLIVPKSFLSIWGGNLKCGFSFGYLQYMSSHVSFIYPNQALVSERLVSIHNDTAFEKWGAQEVSEISGFSQSNPLWLPLNGEGNGKNTSHSFLLEAYKGNKLEFGSIGDQKTDFNNVPLFTQDCQYYKNYEDNDNLDYELGYFYYNYPVREFSPQFEKNIGHVNTSNIIVKKYQYANYFDKRYQGFNMYIGMMNGDHLFTKEWLTSWLSNSSLYPIQKADHTPARNKSSLKMDESWYLPDCKTPILTNIRLVADPSLEPRWQDGTSIRSGTNRDPESGSSQYFIDATDHVMSFSHSWTASSLTSMEHSGSVQFYLNSSMDVPNNVTYDLLSLQDKTFYIEIWAGYRDVPGCDNSNYTRIPAFYKMFTGMCQGGTLSLEYGKNIMTCKLEDYTTVLKGMKFFNSPWFDAMKDVIAINEIMKLAGFRDQGDYDPGNIISSLAEKAASLNPSLYYYNSDGRLYKMEAFGLPSGYNRLEQPSLKFNDGDPFIDAINKISKMSAKLFYFDERGIARFEDYQDTVEMDFEGRLELTPLYQFTANPERYGGQLVFNKIETSFDVSGIANHLKLLTNTPDWHLLIRDHIKWDTIENPEATGFLGFKRTAYQAESIFGSKVAQTTAMNKYAVMFKPRFKVSFETYGLPLRATDIISLEGVVVRVTKVDHVFDASKNQWWMQVECDRFQPINSADLIPIP